MQNMVYNTTQHLTKHPLSATHGLYILYCTLTLGRGRGGGGESERRLERQ
jgi:hypothetical protein